MPGNARKADFSRGKAAVVAFDDAAGTGVQVARPGVVPQPLPGMQHLLRGSRGKVLQPRPTGEEMPASSRRRSPSSSAAA